MRPLAAAVVAALVLPATAAAQIPSTQTSYQGRTSQNRVLTLEVHPKAKREIQRLAMRYRSDCNDGETLRSTFRFAPIGLSGARFARSGTVTGQLTDGRAYTSKVRVTGRFASTRRVTGTFKLTTRIADGKGGVASCATGAVTWSAGPATD